MKLLILGTGSMAERHAVALRDDRGRRDRRRRRDRTRSGSPPSPSEHKIANRFADLDEAIAWGEFDAAANVTPDAVHYPTTMKLHRGRQARVLREAARHDLSAAPARWPTPPRSAASSTWSTSPIAPRRRCRRRAQHRRCRARSASSAISKRRYLQSWLVGKHWGDWRTEERWLWRLSTAHGSQGRRRRHRHPHHRLRHLRAPERHRRPVAAR